MAIKNNLKEILMKRNIKQIDLVDYLNVTKGTVSNIINNKFEPSAKIMFDISNYLKLPIEDIFYDEETTCIFLDDNYIKDNKDKKAYRLSLIYFEDIDIDKKVIKEKFENNKYLKSVVLKIEEIE